MRQIVVIVGAIVGLTLLLHFGVGEILAHHVLSNQWHWVEVHTGTVNESGPYYGFFSGFGSDLGEATLATGLVTAYLHVNCHNKGCPRLGRHVTPKGYRLCKKHVTMPAKALTLHKIHKDHR